MTTSITTMKRLLSAALVLAGLGCREYEMGTLEEPAETPAKTSAESEPDTPAAQPGADSAAAPSGPDAQPAPPQAAAPAVAETKLEKAAVGAGEKGKKYGGGIITEPARVYFRVEERLTFLQVDQAMNLYRGEHGRAPESDEEFREKIIKANQITLPSLPRGDEYWYDAEKGELMIKRPG